MHSAAKAQIEGIVDTIAVFKPQLLQGSIGQFAWVERWRVTGTTAIANTLEEAIKEAYRLSDGVCFEKAYRRSDIGQRALREGK